MTFYITLGMLFLGLLVPKVIRWEVSFYSHLMRDILLVVFFTVPILRSKQALAQVFNS